MQDRLTVGAKVKLDIIRHEYVSLIAYALLLDIQAQLNLSNVINKKVIITTQWQVTNVPTHKANGHNNDPIPQPQTTINKRLQLL